MPRAPHQSFRIGGPARSQVGRETGRSRHVHRISVWLAHELVRLALLLTLLMTLVVYVLATRTSSFSSPGDAARVGIATVAGCRGQATPPVENVDRTALQGLRKDLRGVMFGRSRRLYELGVAAPRDAWSDDEPGKHISLPPGPRDPGGYELRWWDANGDDVVADGFIFAETDQARAFFEQAIDALCRPSSATFTTSSPPDGHDLAWRNPDGFAQEDVYLLRGQRVYRVGVVRAGAGGEITAARRSVAFSLVNSLACALPGAACPQATTRETQGGGSTTH
jgi:hypothetical protein